MERATFEREIEALHAASFAWALACCRYRRQEAEDVLQETYLKVIDDRARFDGRSSLKTWLFSVIRRTAADRARRAWMRGLLLARWFTPEPPAAAPGTEGDERAARAVEALRTLPRRQREVLELVFYQDLTVEQAARTMGVAVGTARIHYHRGKKRLLEVVG
jgi:RNA polymerase sigma-70 factor (ECF subfamily)